MTSVLLHFHPDWPFRGGTVIDGMAASGRYRSQFETRTSNGGLTARLGGDRWRWESRLFGGRYDAADAADRPVYGAVDFGDPYGAAPRFGSAYVRLAPEATSRATFCYPDSVFEPADISMAEGLDDLVARMRVGDADLLDRYVEAHIHGGVVFARDVDAIVLDPCFRNTNVHARAAKLADVEFHDGYRVDTSTLDPGYRGSEPVQLAQVLSNELTPDVIGSSARSKRHDPQTLKRVWHLLARYGRVS